MRTSLRAGLCLLAGAVAAPELARLSTDLALEGCVRAVLARAPGVHAGRVASRGGATTIENLSLAGHGWGLTAELITLALRRGAPPGFVAPAFARPAEAAAENVVLTLGDTKVVIPHVEARGTDLTSQDLAALLDPADPMSPAGRLEKLTAAKISAPTIVLGSPRIPDPSAGDHLTLKDVSFTDVEAGRVGMLAVGGMAFSSQPSSGGPPASAPPALFETGRIAVDGLDLPLALEMATGSRAESATALQPVVRSVAVSGVTLRPDAATTVQVGAMLAGALRGRPLTLPPSDAMSLYGKPEPSRTPADRQILSDLAVDAAGSAALDHLELRDVAATNSGGGSFRVGRAVVDGWEVLKLGSLAVEDVAFSASATDVSLGRFVFSGYDGTGLVDLLKRQVVDGPQVSLPQFIPNRTSLALTDLHVAVPTSAGGMGALNPDKRVVLDVPIAKVGGSRDAATGALASQASIAMAYDVSAGASDPSYRDMNQFGLARLDLGAGYRSSFDPATKQLNLERLWIDAQNLGQVSVGAVLGNASLDMFQAGGSPDEAVQAAQNLVFKTFTFVFVNAGMVEKVLPPLAASANVSVPLFRAQLKAQAEITVTEMLGATPAAARIITALRTFIDTPKTLGVVVSAPSGLSLAAASSSPDSKALLDALDIRVVANR